MPSRRACATLLALSALLCVPMARAAPASPGASVFLEDLTWTELRDALRAGKTTIIIPVGGTEQNGPHMALGKHNLRAHALAGRIAERLGNAIVAPVVSYVPEGQVDPPTEHMRYTGTISVPEAAFKAVLDGAARSFRQHGFRDVVLFGDSGNYQAALKAVADKLNHDWANGTTHAHYIDAYYRATQTAYVQALHDHGLNETQIGTHAGSADTALLMAVAPAAVRKDRLATAAREGHGVGVRGDPRAATVALGQLGVDFMLDRTVEAIRSATAARR